MRDEEARFCADLARSCGRFDWWNIKNEHTPFEWACQLAMYQVNPFGDRRADIRAATNTTNQIVATPGVKIQAADAQELFRQVRDYLKCYEQNDDEDFDPQALRKVKGEQ